MNTIIFIATAGMVPWTMPVVVYIPLAIPIAGTGAAAGGAWATIFIYVSAVGKYAAMAWIGPSNAVPKHIVAAELRDIKAGGQLLTGTIVNGPSSANPYGVSNPPSWWIP